MTKRHPPLPPPPPVGSSLADLLRQRGVPVGDHRASTASPAAAAAPPSDAEIAACGKLVVRRERKGHGGKTVTVVEGLALPARQLEEVARALRVALGCGSRVDGDRVVVQGDHAAGVETWLRKRGARRIIVGN